MDIFYKTIFVKILFWLPIGAIIFWAGCATVGPDYTPPKTKLPTEWYTPLRDGLTNEEIDHRVFTQWWTTLNDPQLSSLIELAVIGNLNLKKAKARIREARAQRGIAKADLFPTFYGEGSATWSRSSKDKGTGKSSDLFVLSFDAGWEIDVFGGVRRSVEAAEADLEASKEDLGDVLVSLVAEVALNYIELRTYQKRLTVAEANLEIQKETYQLTLWRHQAGLSDELVVEQARYNLESTRSKIPSLWIGMKEAMNRLSVLLGEEPGALHKELEEPKPIPVPPLKIAIGVPADILRKRPDIRRAERQLAAQTARIGVAKADLYPKFTLSGSIGLETLSLSNPSSSGVWTVTGGPKISWAIFKANTILHNVEKQSALQEQYLIAYEATVISALEEIENVLVAYGEEHNRRQALEEAVQAARKAVELAKQKYKVGLSDFNNVLDAERSLLSFQDQLIQSEGEITTNLIRLYKSLGGGWTSLIQREKK